MLTQEDHKFIADRLSELRNLANKSYLEFDNSDHKLRTALCNHKYSRNNCVLSALIIHFGKSEAKLEKIEQIFKLFLYFDRKLIACQNDLGHTPLLCLFLTRMQYKKANIALLFIASGADITEVVKCPAAMQNLKHHLHSIRYNKMKINIAVLSYIDSLDIDKNLKLYPQFGILKSVTAHAIKRKYFFEKIKSIYKFIYNEEVGKNLIISLKTESISSPLHSLVHSVNLLFKQNSFKRIAIFLINEGISINAKSYAQWNTLHEAAKSDSNSFCIKPLLELGIDINSQTNNNTTSLIIAAMENNLNCVRVLLKCNAGVNLQDKLLSNTALHYAFQKDNIMIVKKLISHDAKLKIENSEGKTPFHYSALKPVLDELQSKFESKPARC